MKGTGQEAAKYLNGRTAIISLAVVLTGLAVWTVGGPAAKSGGRLLSLRTSFYSDPGCPDRGEFVTNFARDALRRAKEEDDPLLPHSSSYDGFLRELKVSLDRHMLPDRAIWWLFSDASTIYPRCSGDWMEFGVFSGGSVNHTATWRKNHCAPGCPAVYGFDTFTGLPEVWAQQEGDQQFAAKAFDVGGIFPPVVDNVHLVKGLFSESLPPFLQLQSVWTGKTAEHAVPLSYLHIDCDLYVGAHDAFTLLSHKIVPGTVIVFDEIVNYKLYREHEVKAFWEWLQVSGAKVATIGVKGPVEGQTFAMELDVSVKEWPWIYQSAAFVVVSKPGYPPTHIGL